MITMLILSGRLRARCCVCNIYGSFLFFFQRERVQVCMLRVRVGAGNVSKVHAGAGANFVGTGA